MMSRRGKQFYEFGPFRLDPEKLRLLRGDDVAPLTPKAAELLLYLVRNAGRVVEKDELLEKVWRGAFVEEGVLSVNVRAARVALGEDPEEPQYIETVRGKGYCFIADVREVTGAEETLPRGDAGLLVERRTRSQIVVEETGPDEEPAPPRLEGQKWGAGASDSTVGRLSRRAAVAAAVLLAGVAATYLWVWSGSRDRRAIPAARSLAVLPLKPLGAGEQAENYLGVGIADALITRLGGLGQIRVRPTSSVLRFDNPRQDSLAAARALGVDAVLEGSYQREGDRVRVTVQLVSVRDGAQVWADTFDEDFTHIFELEDSISQEVARALAANLGGAEERLLAHRPTDNVDAYQLYLKGRYFWNKRTVDGLERGIEYFSRAVEADPHFAAAHVGLAESYDLLVFYDDRPPDEFFPRARAAALRALEIDDTLGKAHVALARVKAYYEWDAPGAEAEFRRAVASNPDDATARQWYGEYLGRVGKAEEGLEELRRARELDPLSLAINMDFGTAFYASRQYDRAVEQYLKTLELEPDFAVCRTFLAMSYEGKGLYEEAVAEHRKAIALAGDRPILWALLGHALARAGREGEARAILDRLARWQGGRYLAPSALAIVYEGLGEKERALALLDRAAREHDPWLVQYLSYPLLDGLRADPRYAELERRVGLRGG